MGTRADFYLGRGPHAQWLGSIAYDGYPKGIPASVLNVGRSDHFRANVLTFLESRRDHTLPEQGWPWPWMDSRTTDYAYAFEADRVYASEFGSPWFDPKSDPAPDDYLDDVFGKDAGPLAVFPDMTNFKQREKFGPHSGLLVIGEP